MAQYNLVAENTESTVVAEYASEYVNQVQHQSEAQLEQSLIDQLDLQGCKYLNIHHENDLINNLRLQLENLNDYKFSDTEWQYFFTKVIAKSNNTVVEKTEMLQDSTTAQLLQCDNGTTKNIYLLDKQYIHNNTIQVINQYVNNSGTYKNRYDVTILVNGLPVVHIELKKRGKELKEAFNQIDRYKNDSFWAESGLYEYIQLFVISNGTFTKYYSNTTRQSHIDESIKKRSKSGRKTSHSFEFTSWWADANNKPITDLRDFTKTFFTKHTLLNIITKYCVFTVDKILLVMRPYQIVATERIINKIRTSENYKNYGSIEGGGYIWHTTGSGKTLTSFKTAQLATKLDFIHKVLFVVDRKDLDYQTMKEYDKFEKGAANSNTSTAKLKKQLEDNNCKIIITTIQKLSVFIKKNAVHKALKQRFIIIFDECHRSQFGDMHKAITKNFKNYNIFGFTGTPIFSENALSSNKIQFRTTEQAFGEKLHTYTIVDAITDENVLPFKIEYIRTMKESEQMENEEVQDINREKVLSDPRRIKIITKYILDKFAVKTMRNLNLKYSFNVIENVKQVSSQARNEKIEEIKKTMRLSGFNSIFAVSSIEYAKQYYAEFKRQMALLPADKQLKVATIFSYGVNENNDAADTVSDECTESTMALDVSSREFLDSAIQDYNVMFGTNYDTSDDKFQNYYKDVSLRLKNRQLDLLIVVNMFLTGFDATTLNTLWVDKNLRMHGLLQAFSRTNRILNSIKTFGNIVCFRNLENSTNESISLFGNKDACGIVILKTYKEYMNGYEHNDKYIKGYLELVDELKQKFECGKLIVGEKTQKEFIKLYGTILKLRNILSNFDDFVTDDVLTDFENQNYQSNYCDLYRKFRDENRKDQAYINDDIVFEIDLIKRVDINIDYILDLINQYKDSNNQDREVIVRISNALSASPELRDKKELIERFIETINPSADVENEWTKFISEQRKIELDAIISEEKLVPEKTYNFITNAFRDGFIQTVGTAIVDIMPKVSLFSGGGTDRLNKKKNVIEKLTKFLNKFWSLSSDHDI